MLSMAAAEPVPAKHGILQHIVDIEVGLLADGGVALLCIVEDDLSLGVDDLCERAGLAERAAVREGAVGLASSRAR